MSCEYRVVITDNGCEIGGECAITCDTYERALSTALENLEYDPMAVNVEIWKVDNMGNEDLIAETSDVADHL